MHVVLALQTLAMLTFGYGALGAECGLLSRKERLTCFVVCDVLVLVANFVLIATGHGGGVAYVCTALWAYWLRRDYRLWRDADDDDEPRKRRRAWVKSHLPKPITAVPLNPS